VDVGHFRMGDSTAIACRSFGGARTGESQQGSASIILKFEVKYDDQGAVDSRPLGL
jgi:hypothetical protein